MATSHRTRVSSNKKRWLKQAKKGTRVCASLSMQEKEMGKGRKSKPKWWPAMVCKSKQNAKVPETNHVNSFSTAIKNYNN